MDNLGDRSTYLGGSDIADVFSLPPYGCAYNLWAEKRKIAPDFEYAENPLFALGHALEPFIAGCYAKDKQALLSDEPDVYKDFTLDAAPFMRCHADRFILIGSVGVEKQGILECKSCGSWVCRKIKKTGELPDYWLLQMQSYLWFYGAEWGDFAALNRDSGELAYVRIDRNEALIKQIIEACQEFWKLVEHGPAPEKLAPDDKRCIKCNRQTQCHGRDVVPFTPRDKEGVEYVDARNDVILEGAVYGVIEASAMVKEAEEVETERKDYLKSLLEKTPAVITNWGKAIYQEVITNRWDTKKLEGAFPELKKDYCKQTKSRTLRVYPRGGK